MGLRGIPKVTNIYVATAALILVIFSLNRIMNSRVENPLLLFEKMSWRLKLWESIQLDLKFWPLL